jgi:hypothetical protein
MSQLSDSKKSQLILSLIKKTFPEIECKRIEINDIYYVQIIHLDAEYDFDIRAIIWHKLKVIIENNFENTCNICFELLKDTKTSTCSQCCEVICFECYIKIIKANMGIMKCPYCNYQYGEKLSPFQLNYLISECTNYFDNLF